MKNRKFIVVAFMLVACMIVGVGYAVLTDTLNLEGDAEVSHTNAENAFDGDVYFSAVSTGDGYTAEILQTNPDKGNFTVTGLEGINDTVTITFTIMNDSDIAALVKMDAVNTILTNDTYFAVTYSIDATGVQIPAGGTQDVTVTVKLLKTPVLAENQTISGTFTYELDVSSVQS